MNSGNAVVKMLRNFLSVSILFLCAGSIAFSQAGRGSVSGLVTDPGGALIQGAKVVLLNPATGTTQHAVTTSAGLYTFISLNPGVYKVTVSESGFKSYAQEKISVNVDQTTEVNITLQVGSATETVTVTEGVSLVEPSNSTVGSLIGSETIDRVPLVSRNVYDLIQLSAGVNAVNGSPNSSDSMQSVQNISVGRPGVDVSADTINGSLVGSVYYMVDGAPIGIAENNSAAIIPAMEVPEDGVQEVRVETQNTPASYQSGGAGVISLVTKSGTNKLHGDLFGVFRPNVLAANDYFNKQSQASQPVPTNTPPDFYRYQEGGAIGGAIIKDKLFFFGDYEDTQQEQFEGLKTYNVPTSLERTGDFSQMGFTIYDPTQPDNPDGTRQAFPGNVIPTPNPIALLYLQNMPKCNVPTPSACDQATTDINSLGYNYAVPGLDPLHAHRFDVRVDWAKSEKQRIFTRFSYDRMAFSTANVFPSPGWDPDYALNVTNGRSALVADDLTLNSSTVLNLRYSFTRRYEKQGGPPSYLSTDITNLGSVNGAPVGFPSALAAQQVVKQLPFMLFDDYGGGVGGTADYNNFVDASENSDANVTLTKIHGKHEISTGFEWMKRYFNVGQPYAPAGTYSFGYGGTDQQTSPASGNLVGGSDYASMLIGMGDSGEFDRPVYGAESNPYYAAFIEDTYHPTTKLTITAGLRWDIFGGRNERFNRQEYFDPTVSNTYLGVPYTGAELYVGGSNRSPFKTNLHDFGPRLAFAFQPVNHFVIRGGVGFYYGPSTEMAASAAINTDGFSSSTYPNSNCPNLDGNWVFYGSSACTITGGAALPADNFTVPYSLSNPFPNGLIPIFTTAPAGAANNLGIGINTVQHAQRTPTTYNYNFGLEYELPYQVVVSAGYVGSRGLFLPFSSVDQNMLDLATIAQYGDSLCFIFNPSCGIPNTWEPILPATNAWSGQSTVPQWMALEKYPQFGNGGFGSGVTTWGYPAGDSEYNSLQTKVQKRLTGHFTTLATFTWAKLITDDGNPPLGFVGSHNGSVQDWRNLSYERSISPQDLKYSFTGQVSYDLPIGKGQAVDLHGVANAFAGGWTTNAILYLSTGVPIHAPGSGNPLTPFNQRSDMICDPAKGAPHTTNQWFNYSCFATPASPYLPGTAPAYLDNVRTRGARNLDLSVYKTFKFTETKALRFDISGYNMTNFAQYGYPTVNSTYLVQPQQPCDPNTNGYCASFGHISGNVNSPRQFQFGARFTF